MSLTPKERVRRALRHEPVDRLPTQIKYTEAAGQGLAAHLGVPLEDLPRRLHNHILRLDLTYPRRLSDDGEVAYDWWGVGWSTEIEGYWPVDSPLADTKDLDAIPWPDPSDPDLLDEAEEIVASDDGRPPGRQHFITPNLGFCLFERAWSLRGFERFLLDLAVDLSFVEELLDRITEIQVTLARRFLTLGLDGGYFGDDYGAQDNLLFSPRLWRDLFKPRLARMFAVFREEDLPVILHTDGDVSEIVPDLVDIGLTTLNPVQPEVLDHAWLERTFGTSLAFYGGVSTQTVLPQGSPDEVSAAVEACVDTLAPDDTGLIVAPSHRLTTDVPMANVDALLAAFAAL